jgi:hypothetical protein
VSERLPGLPAVNDEPRRWSPTIGVSAIVELRETHGHHPVGTLGMVVGQRPEAGHRYQVMVPGDPITGWYPVEQLRLVQGIDLNVWWRRR